MTVWRILISAIGISWIPFLVGTLLNRADLRKEQLRERKGTSR
jgi:hypothetical protein